MTQRSTTGLNTFYGAALVSRIQFVKMSGSWIVFIDRWLRWQPFLSRPGKRKQKVMKSGAEVEITSSMHSSLPEVFTQTTRMYSVLDKREEVINQVTTAWGRLQRQTVEDKGAFWAGTVGKGTWKHTPILFARFATHIMCLSLTLLASLCLCVAREGPPIQLGPLVKQDNAGLAAAPRGLSKHGYCSDYR